MDRRACGHSPQPRQGTSPFLDFQRGDTWTAAPRCQKAAPPQLPPPPSAPGLEALRKVRGRCGSGERDHKWGRPRLSVSGSDGRSLAITRPGMATLDRKPRASREPAAGQGGGVTFGNRTAAGGTAAECRAAPPPPMSLLTDLHF